MGRYRLVRRRATLGALLAGIALIAMLATAQSAGASIGPLELSGPSHTIRIPTLYSVSQSINHHPGSAAYGSGGAPSSASELSITAPVDEGPALVKAVVSGTHFKKGSLLLQKNGSPYEAICMSDAFVTSYQAGGHGDMPTESLSINYTKITFKYVKQGTGTGASCNDVSSPPVESTLIGLNASGSKLTARVDCLILHCRGILSVSLPNSACPAVASQSVQSGGKSACSFTGPVRVGLNGGKVSFNGDGTAFTGGVKVGIGGTGGFSMGDGSKRVLRLTVPPPLQKWLKGHSKATLGSIIVVRGLGRAIVEREVLGTPAKIYSGIPSLDETPPPPLEQPQSLLITQCSTLVVGTPTKVTVDGTLSPPRGGATVTLTYTPVKPPPLPPAITDTVTTSAAGTFTDTFDREVAGIPHSWSVVASIAAGGGYAAATSPPCAIPEP